MTYRISGSSLRDYQLSWLKDIMHGKHKHILLVSPRRSGKSVFVFHLVNSLVNKYWVDTKMRINATIFAPQAKQCRAIYVDNILQDGRKLFELSNAKFVESRLSLEYSFGSKIKLSGSDMIDNHMGAGNKIVVLDEYALSKPETFQRLYPMVQATNGHMIVTSTPRGKNGLWDLYQKVKDNPDWLVVHTDVFKLGLMAQDEYDSLPMSTNYKRQEFLCSWDSPFENAIYNDCNIYHGDIDYSKPIYVSIDLGISDSMVLMMAQLEMDKINIIHSIEVSNTSLQQLVVIFRQWLSDANLKVELIYVPHDISVRDLVTGQSRKDYLTNEGFNLYPVKRAAVMDGVEICRTQWHNISWMPQVKAIESIKAYVTDPNTNLPKHDGASHAADALRYLITGLQSVINKNEPFEYNKPQYYRTAQYQRNI